jgi:hypothetical protein
MKIQRSPINYSTSLWVMHQKRKSLAGNILNAAIYVVASSMYLVVMWIEGANESSLSGLLWAIPCVYVILDVNQFVIAKVMHGKISKLPSPSIEIAEESIKFETQDQKTELMWSAVKGFVENKSAIGLVVESQLIIPIPKSSFLDTNELAELNAVLIAKSNNVTRSSTGKIAYYAIGVLVVIFGVAIYLAG